MAQRALRDFAPLFFVVLVGHGAHVRFGHWRHFAFLPLSAEDACLIHWQWSALQFSNWDRASKGIRRAIRRTRSFMAECSTWVCNSSPSPSPCSNLPTRFARFLIIRNVNSLLFGCRPDQQIRMFAKAATGPRSLANRSASNLWPCAYPGSRSQKPACTRRRKATSRGTPPGRAIQWSRWAFASPQGCRTILNEIYNVKFTCWTAWPAARKRDIKTKAPEAEASGAVSPILNLR